MRHIKPFLTIAASILFIAGPAFAGPVHLISLNDDTINPVTAEYIIGSIERAENEKAEALIIQLDTPGGLLTSTRLIVKRMLTAEVPVVVYIAPNGSRAGSAGVFITYASHIAAMAPSTNIGAAHPVKLGNAPKPGQQQNWEELKELIQDLKESQHENNPKQSEDTAQDITPDQTEDAGETASKTPMEDKILQDTVAFIKAIAKTRGRNMEWGVKSVVESKSITSDEALDKGVIEILADDVSELIDKLNGMEVEIDGTIRTLDTSASRVVEYPMTERQKFFNILANPNIAYFLLILGFYGLLFEVTHPGFSVPGILGAIFLILAFYSMQTLPTNYAGLALMILALCLFIAEAYVPGFGLLTLGGMVCLVLGSMLLFESADPVMRVSNGFIWTFAITTGGIMFLIVGFLVKTRNRKGMVGQEGMIGLKGEVKTQISPSSEGKVFVHGELWTAVSDEDIGIGEKIEVIAIEGLKLTVKKNTVI